MKFKGGRTNNPSRKTNPDGRRTLQSAPETCRGAKLCECEKRKRTQRKRNRGEHERQNQPQKT